MTVSSNKCKRGGMYTPFFLHVQDESFTVSSIKITLPWILQVSEPHKEIRGIKEKDVFLSNCGNPKKSLWPPVMLNKALSVCNVLELDTCVLMETYLALFGEGNVISIVLLNKNVQKAHFLFFLFCFHLIF